METANESETHEISQSEVDAWRDNFEARAAAAYKKRPPLLPRLTPRQAHRDDLRHALVVRKLPPRESGIAVEQLFDAPGPVGWYETPGGVRVQIVVDPAMPPGAWRLENAATGERVNAGDFGRR